MTGHPSGGADSIKWSPLRQLVFEGALAHELAEERGGGDGVERHGDEIVEELAQAGGDGVFRSLLRHLFEEWEGLHTQGGKLVEE